VITPVEDGVVGHGLRFFVRAHGRRDQNGRFTRGQGLMDRLVGWALRNRDHTYARAAR